MIFDWFLPPRTLGEAYSGLFPVTLLISTVLKCFVKTTFPLMAGLLSIHDHIFLQNDGENCEGMDYFYMLQLAGLAGYLLVTNSYC